MWFATSNGIQRFDGNRWLWLAQQKNSNTSLPDNDVASLLEDKQERFWVETASGICLLNRNNFEFTSIKIAWLPEHKVHNFQSLAELQDGRIWFTLANGGLYYYNEAAKQFVPADKIIPASSYSIYQIAYDSSHQRYFLGTDNGIVIYSVLTKQFSHSGFNPQGIALLKFAPAKESNVNIYLNDSAQLWFSSLSIHSCYDIKKDSVIFCDSTSKIWGVLGYATDRSGTTWSYGYNIAKMNLTTGRMEVIMQTPDELYGINFQNGNYLMEDNENSYWIATTNGVFIYNRFQQQFFHHTIKSYANGELLKHINVWGFIELADSSIVALTTRGEGLYFFDKNFNQFPSKFNLAPFANANSRVNIRCGLKDRDNHVWIGCEKGPLLKLYPENGKVEKINDTVFADLGIYSMTKDKDGNLWFGTFKHAIIRRDAITGEFSRIVPMPEHFKGLDNIFCLFYDGDKYIWAATSKSGLLKINTQTNTVEKSYANEQGIHTSIPSSTINSVIGSSSNELMMSTPLGIVVMDIAKENFRLLNTADGLPDNNVAAMLKGEKRNVWFASDNGISKMNQQGMKVTSYGILEGLTNENFNFGAAFQLNDGRMLFGYNEGFTSFAPSAFLKETVPADVRITGIRLFDKYLNVDSILNEKKGIVLNYSQNFLTIEFSNMSLLGGYHTLYYYQLEGVDKDWIITNGMPQATYTYLPGGEYIFKVKCVTRGGIASEKIISFKIKIIPPVWKQWWFYLLCIIAAAGVTYLLLNARYRRKMEAEKVRNRIAKDLHDDMGSTLSTINILSEMAKKKIDTDIPATKKFIHQISDNSNRIMESMDDIVWNIDTTNESMENTLSRMREFAGNLLEARGVNYTFKEDEQIKHINLELGRRHDFFMIFKEAVNNLCKYSDCTTVQIDVLVKKNILILLITDDGKGFDHTLQADGNGLINMHQRAVALKGTLNIKSEINEGTKVELKIPV
ncbi:MAG: two-component regulator propeller domain-containing protein [Ginsengibacter sp.]